MWCQHCQDDEETTRDLDNGFICCTGCGKVIDHDVYTDEPTFIKDSKGQSRLAGSMIRNFGGASLSRTRTLEKGKEEISYIRTRLQMGGGEGTDNAAQKFYEIAVDKNFTRGRRTSYVAAACLYLHCRCEKKPYLLIDFSDCLDISVYVLGACFLELCKILRLADHPIVQRLVDPSIFIHRFTDRLIGESHEGVTKTALRIVASMKRDWMQTGRKPSGLCGAALYIAALSHGFNFTKSDVVTVVHVCEATLTKRLIEFENTESGGLTIDEFLTRAEELDRTSKANQLPRPGEVLCEHKGDAHFAHGLCRICFDDLIEISGGLEGGAEPPAFQRAEMKRMEQEKVKEKNKESSFDEIEAGACQIDSHPTKLKSPAPNEHEETDANDEAEKFETVNENDADNLSDIDDVEVDGYLLHNEEEKRLKKIIWEEMNKEYLEEQAAKEAAAELSGGVATKPKKKRKQRSADNGKSYNSPLEATKEMLKKKPFSSRVNYEALEGLYTSEQEKAKEQGTKFGTVDANGKQDTNQEDSTLDDGEFDDIDYDYTGEDGDYAYEDGGVVYDEEFEEA